MFLSKLLSVEETAKSLYNYTDFEKDIQNIFNHVMLYQPKFVNQEILDAILIFLNDTNLSKLIIHVNSDAQVVLSCDTTISICSVPVNSRPQIVALLIHVV